MNDENDEAAGVDADAEPDAAETAAAAAGAVADHAPQGEDGEGRAVDAGDEAVAAAEDLSPASYDDVLRFWAGMFVSVAEDAATALENLDSVVEPAHRNAIAATWNAVGFVAMRGAAAIGAWLDGVPADAPEMVAATEDPGDLTCPRCDGPIPLTQLRGAGICETCQAREDGAAFGAQLAEDAEAVG